MSTTSPETILYASSFSELTYNTEKKLIVAAWKESSRKLLAQGVKDEINRLLEFVVSMRPENIIVDARHYYFMDNNDIQGWITGAFVPQLLESNVKQYAFVVNAPPEKSGHDMDTEDVLLHVEYFSSMEEAMKWIQ